MGGEAEKPAELIRGKARPCFSSRGKLIGAVSAAVLLCASAVIAYRHFYARCDQVAVRVIDGDTFVLADEQRVRLIGIDTPEYHYSAKLYRDSRRSGKDVQAIRELGGAAYRYLKAQIEGKRVRLEFDVEKRDKYNRLLAYVYLPDGTFINAKILRDGYGRVMTIPPNVKYADLFVRLEREARQSGRGLWGV